MLAIYVPLWLFSTNRGLFDTSDIYRPVFVSAVLALCIFAALALLFRNAHKAAFLTGIGIVCFFSFSLLRSHLPMNR